MSPIQNAERRNMSSAAHWRVLGLLLLAVAIGCGEEPNGPPFLGGGSSGDGGIGGSAGSGGDGCLFGCGGSGGSGGTLGSGGSGGTLGSGGTAGSGGMAGTGGAAGSGGIGGSAGVGGTGGCMTNALCHTCPDRFPCETDANCFAGYYCIPSGCETQGGAEIKQCQPARGPSCVDVSECPNATDYECGAVAGGPFRCLRVTPGCSPATETYDCAPGFSCEGGNCVDRRVPCNDYRDCPKSHVCKIELTASFCVRVYRTCHDGVDCAGFGSFCADVDGDGATECAGDLGGSGAACVSSGCTNPSAPVCEVAGTGTTAFCGNHRLCRPGIDDCGPGFECTGLSQDDRTECVPVGGTCQATPCPLQQVCAAPRNGVDPPSCQSGSAP